MASLYSDNKDFSQILSDIHERIKIKMKRNTSKKEAQELQNILQQIKIAAKDFDNVDNSYIGQVMRSEYYDLIDTAFKLQKNYHNSNLKANTLFRRSNKTKTVKEADNIFEEDLAAVLAAGEILGGNENININCFLMGTQVTGTRASKQYNNLNKDVDESAEKIIKKLMEKENRRASTEIRNATGKIDISGKNITLNYTKELPFNIQRLMHLMKDATVSAKSYTSHSYSLENKKEFSEIGLHLGNSNLYKAVTGALSEIQLGHKQQMSVFYRGMNTILGNNHGYGELTMDHFNHLRFVYELRGSGLLDENGMVLPVKYIIYNDPSSDAIFVRDTASIIFEAFESSLKKKSSLFSEISLAASRVKS